MRRVGAGLLLLAVGCGGSDDDGSSAAPAPYAFDAPTHAFALHRRLDEISGLARLDADHVVAVEDERGRLYVVALASGRVVEEHPFGERGDYEDVALVGDDAWVLRSDGVLFEVRAWRSGQPAVTPHDTGLSKRNNLEGLAYDAAGGRLLLAARDEPGAGLADARAIYAFDLATGTRRPEPVVVLRFDDLDRRAPDGKRARDFAPAALGLHPQTGELYVLSARARWLAVVGADGALRAVHGLPKAWFNQPEGLAFLEDGELVVSNEKGGQESARLLRFAYEP